MLNPLDVTVDLVEDKPERGMWHCGPNACWIKATHLPTRQSVTVYSGGLIQHKARALALEALELILAIGDGSEPLFPERGDSLLAEK